MNSNPTTPETPEKWIEKKFISGISQVINPVYVSELEAMVARWRKYPDRKPPDKHQTYLVRCTWHNSHSPDTVGWQGLLFWTDFYEHNPDGPETKTWGWSPADIEDVEFIEDNRFSDLYWIPLEEVAFCPVLKAQNVLNK